ncbi:RPA-interacting protein, C-terminal domain [Plasmopara halstedii]|uniref:RPA-interacting protein, C-terminal domain n=1 Tax=Plasmopara halstedii TaxID=4781 RepID=A0A0P1ATM0_PLAHL|nr:RPA-interacting protein, C-terminal domain [Plasmopara halstedii]CEG45533.1 RPA-interacting protein, C-terminal domain [Plasmopara halstedii]|eukprot:XP_024581902.1 RPA-interacting protein, C-terminal domain [Plasmopara halstedii]
MYVTDSTQHMKNRQESNTFRKTFTVRDGFHLRSYNAETYAAIAAQQSSLEQSSDAMAVDDDHCRLFHESIKTKIVSAPQLAQQRLRANTRLTMNVKDPPKIPGSHAHKCADEASATMNILNQILQSENVYQGSNCENESRKAFEALKAPEEWLIYRHRLRETKQLEANKLLEDTSNLSKSHVRVIGKNDEVRLPMKPTSYPTLTSTYSKRVAAARPKKHMPFDHEYNHHDKLPETSEQTSQFFPIYNARAQNNLLKSQPEISAATPTETALLVYPEKPSIDVSHLYTRRSVMRHETAMVLHSRSLSSRINELRNVPNLLKQIEAHRLREKKQHIAEHGADIVAKNCISPRTQGLHKRLQTPLLPSATDCKINQANKRKQELDAAREYKMQRTSSRWQVCHDQCVKFGCHNDIQSQWLVIVELAGSSNKWLLEFKKSHQNFLEMIKRLQRFWRQRRLLQLTRSQPSFSLSSAAFRMPSFIVAVIQLQRSARVWLKQKHHRERRSDVVLIVTAWFDFQDVKFRRIILRFRKRVREFQSMWRSWRAITAARVKLLLIVWANMERRIKSHRVGTSEKNLLPSDSDSRSRKDSSLLAMLQQIRDEKPQKQQSKRLNGMHRHSRSGGAIRMLEGGATIDFQSLKSANSSPISHFSRTSKRTKSISTAQTRRDNMGHNTTEMTQFHTADFCKIHRNLSTESPEFDEHLLNHKKNCRCSNHLSLLQVPSPNQLVPVSAKVPLSLKVKVLRKLLCDKRKMYSNARDRGLKSWSATQKKMRSQVLHYDVLYELAAFRQLQAKYTTFLVLHSITESEMTHLIYEFLYFEIGNNWKIKMTPPLKQRIPLKRLSLSPPVCKAQLHQRCLQRIKRDRAQLMAKLRSPGSSSSVSEEIQLLVANEQHKASLSASPAAAVSVDDMLLLGHLKESEYLEIIHALEDALRHEFEKEKNEEGDNELRLAEHMAELEDAELEAMLAGMELMDDLEHSNAKEQQHTSIQVLCPSCKAGYLREHKDAQASTPFILCSCGFTFRAKCVYTSLLEDFREKIVNAFITHRNTCSADPSFRKQTLIDNSADSLCIQCTHCGCDNVLP